MQLNKIICISIGKYAKSVFTEFENMRPNNISFSMFLANAVRHYIDTHDEPTDIYGEVPNFYSNIENWKSEIKNMTPEQFVKLQQRNTQITNLIKQETRKKI